MCINSVQRALHGLYLAWEQRLLFTVGTSMTSGQSNCVTWNDIHLKTNRTGPDHSYPDPNFLVNLMQVPHYIIYIISFEMYKDASYLTMFLLILTSYLQELAGFGITEAEIGTHMTDQPNLRARGRL